MTPSSIDPLLRLKRLEALAKDSAKPLFRVDQFKVVIKGMQGEPVLPTDEAYADVETP